MTRSVVSIAAALAQDAAGKTQRPLTLAPVATPPVPAVTEPASVPLWADGPAGEERNYGAEIRELVDQWDDGETPSVVIAHAVVDHLRSNDPALLAAYLNTLAVQAVRSIINTRDRSRRAYNRANAVKSVFHDAAKAFEDGDPEPLKSAFLDEPYTMPDGTRRALRTLTGRDLTTVADNYRTQVRDLVMREAFLRALAKACGDQAVGDVYQEEDLARMWTSLGS